MLARSAKTVRRRQESDGADTLVKAKLDDEWLLRLRHRSRSFLIEWRGRADTHDGRTGDQLPLASRALVGKATRLLNIRILLFHRDPLVILHSYIRSKCSLQTLLPPNTRKLPQKARRPLCGPQLRHILHPIAYIEASNVCVSIILRSRRVTWALSSGLSFLAQFSFKHARP